MHRHTTVAKAWPAANKENMLKATAI